MTAPGGGSTGVRGVRPAGASEVAGMARVLTEAFHDDPGFRWCVPSDVRRRGYGPRYFGLLLDRVYLPKGEVHVVGDVDAVAMFAPPGRWEVPTAATLALLPVVAASTRTRLLRTLRGLSAMEAVHRDIDRPHVYLALMGTAPRAQRRGHGSSLLRTMLDRCDREGLPAYLEATSEDNRRLYSRHGFEVVAEHRWVGGGPPWWAMWRDPSRSATPA